MIIKFNDFNKLNESPDNLDFNNDRLHVRDDDAYPFLCKVSNNHEKLVELKIGNNGEYHLELYFKDDFLYPGRIWIDHKVLSFWVYPNEILFKQIISELERQLNIKIFNNGFMIEVILEDDKVVKTEYDPKKTIYDYFYSSMKYSNTFIPIEEYSGSYDIPEEVKIQHLMSWKEKEIAKRMKYIHFKGFGSDKTSWDSKRNIKYRSVIYKESKDSS